MDYESVRPYHSPPLYQPEFQLDVLAKASPGDYSLIGEIKHRQEKFLVKEAEAFVEKAQALMRVEQMEKAVLCVFSSGGFYKNTREYLTGHQIAYTDDTGWLEYYFVG
ncbi:MAG: hypothetical protein GY801_00290 [bacterium]|nr:hypothetical protein [bacterium]